MSEPQKALVVFAVSALSFVGGWFAHKPPRQLIKVHSLNPPDIQLMRSQQGWCSDNGRIWWPARISDERGVMCWEEDKLK